MKVHVFLRDAVKYYFESQGKQGKVNKSTVIGSAIIASTTLGFYVKGKKHYRYRSGNVLDREATELHFHTSLNITEQHKLAIAHIIEKTFLKELRDFADVYRTLTELSYREIVKLFFKKNNIPEDCLYGVDFFVSYLRLHRHNANKTCLANLV